MIGRQLDQRLVAIDSGRDESQVTLAVTHVSVRVVLEKQVSSGLVTSHAGSLWCGTVKTSGGTVLVLHWRALFEHLLHDISR